MSKAIKDTDTLKDLQHYLSDELLGEIPLFFQQVILLDHQEKREGSNIYQRDIAVDAYQTDAYKTRAYHKAISKII